MCGLFATTGGETGGGSKSAPRTDDVSSQAEVAATIVHASAAEYRTFMVRAMLGVAHDFKQGDALE